MSAFVCGRERYKLFQQQQQETQGVQGKSQDESFAQGWFTKQCLEAFPRHPRRTQNPAETATGFC